ASARHLRAGHPDWEWREPNEATEEGLLRAHSAAHVDQICAATHDFDADTPAYPDIFAHAARASGAACAIAQASLGGNAAFSLMRPPGHHATLDPAVGFAFLIPSRGPRSMRSSAARNASRSGISTRTMATAPKRSSPATRGLPLLQ